MVHTGFKEAEFLSWFALELDLIYLSSLIVMENAGNSKWGFYCCCHYHYFAVLVIKPSAYKMLGKCYTIKLYSQPYSECFMFQVDPYFATQLSTNYNF